MKVQKALNLISPIVTVSDEDTYVIRKKNGRHLLDLGMENDQTEVEDMTYCTDNQVYC